MPSEQRVKEVSALYVTIYGEEPTLTQLEQYLGFSESVKTELISSLMMANSGLVDTYETMSSEAKVKDMFKKLFGYSDTEMNAIIAQQAEVAANGGTDGFQYWVNELENNSAMINSNTLAIAFLNGADTQSYARAMNVAEVSSVINSYANTNGMSINIEEYTGQSDIDDLVLGYGYDSSIFDITSFNIYSEIISYENITYEFAQELIKYNTNNFDTYYLGKSYEIESGPSYGYNFLIYSDIKNGTEYQTYLSSDDYLTANSFTTISNLDTNEIGDYELIVGFL